MVVSNLHFFSLKNGPDAGVLFWSGDILGEDGQVADESLNISNDLRLFCGGGSCLSPTGVGVEAGGLLSQDSQVTYNLA